MPDLETLTDYDSEPVKYCANCYSLKVRHEDVMDFDYCGDCGCSDIREIDVDDWEKMYKHRYGHDYITKQKNPKDSYIFKMPLDALKKLVYDNPLWKTIISSFYPSFPKLNKPESIIYFFDKIIQDNRLDNLRLFLKTLKHQHHGRAEERS